MLIWYDWPLKSVGLCGTPIPLISLLDPCRQWFKAKTGFAAGAVSRDVAFCAHTILKQGLLIVSDVPVLGRRSVRVLPRRNGT
ncbi:MAG: hypothetical protein NW703_12525 [Nitrospiraceae bacterium]